MRWLMGLRTESNDGSWMVCLSTFSLIRFCRMSCKFLDASYIWFISFSSTLLYHELSTSSTPLMPIGTRTISRSSLNTCLTISLFLDLDRSIDVLFVVDLFLLISLGSWGTVSLFYQCLPDPILFSIEYCFTSWSCLTFAILFIYFWTLWEVLSLLWFEILRFVIFETSLLDLFEMLSMDLDFLCPPLEMGVLVPDMRKGWKVHSSMSLN